MKKVLQIVKNVLVGIVVAFAVFMMVFTLISVNTVNKNDRSFFGYRMYIVLSDSMKATDFDAGDLVVVGPVEPAKLQEGDIISYMSQNPSNFGETVTHKIRKRTRTADGEPGFITYGTTTNVDDETIVTYPYVLGQYKFRLAKVGTFFQFLKTTPGYLIFILAPFTLLILYLGVRSILLFKRYKGEQMKEIEEEQRKVEKERKESEKMLEELRRLKEELAKANAGQTGEAPKETEGAKTVETANQPEEAKAEAGGETPIIEMEEI